MQATRSGGATPVQESRSLWFRLQHRLRHGPSALAHRMAAHARSRGLTPTQLALGWVWNSALVNGLIGGPKTLVQWQDYLGAMNSPFTAEDEAFVSSLVSTGHASTAGYNDPAYPVVGRVARNEAAAAAS